MVLVSPRKDGSKKYSGCPNPIGHLEKDGKFLYNVSCKGWACEHCSSVKKYKILQRFEKRKGSFRYRMLTLTEWKHPLNVDNAKNLTKHWNKLKASLLKHNINIDHFLWTKEYKPLYSERFIPDALLYPHMHILLPLTINLELLSHLWFLATNHTADNVHIPDDDDEKMILKNPAAYMTKYLTKSDMSEGFKKGERRYSFSQDMPPLEGIQEFIIDGQKYYYNPYKKIEGAKFKLGSPVPVMPPPTGIKPDIPDDEILYDVGLGWTFNKNVKRKNSYTVEPWERYRY